MEENKIYTISIYSENNVGLLNRVSSIFLKRHINILSFSTSQSEIPDLYRFVIVVELTETAVRKLTLQIDKQIDVVKAFYHTDEETIFQESALYKIKKESAQSQEFYQLMKDNHAQIMNVGDAYIIVEKTGFREDTEKLRLSLISFGLLQFVRSGRISITKSKMNITELIEKFNTENK